MVSQSKKLGKMKIGQFVFLSVILFFSVGNITAQTKIIEVDHFNKVVVSPHIQINFIQGDKEKVVIDDAGISLDKLNVEVSGKTLHIYLDDAKMYTKSEKIKYNGHKTKHPVYRGTKVRATITYKNLEDISLRGEETYTFESLIETDKFILNIYGESKVFLNDVKFNSLNTKIYGESYLEIKHGSIGRQKFVTYGESEINTLGVNNESAKITSYGESNVKLAVSKDLKVTAYGDANIAYKGSPIINKGIVIGDARIRKID
jgi:Putative auto-transporter adhesin, head GIN domain